MAGELTLVCLCVEEEQVRGTGELATTAVTRLTFIIIENVSFHVWLCIPGDLLKS